MTKFYKNATTTLSYSPDKVGQTSARTRTQNVATMSHSPQAGSTKIQGIIAHSLNLTQQANSENYGPQLLGSFLFKGHGQGRNVQNFGTDRKVLPQGIYM